MSAPRKPSATRFRPFHPVNIALMAFAVLSASTLWRTDYLWLDGTLLLLLLLIAVIAGKRLQWNAAPPRWCQPFRRLSRRPVLACALPAILSVVLRLALLPWIPVPHPIVPDEFSHLFLAKTFLAGRLANPGHPLWQHFESIHILSLPTTYSSMYPPGQALFLAFGKLVAGEFFAGVLLGTAFFCAALTWFLRKCLPPGWALYGGLFAAIRIGGASYWNNGYWGGSIAAGSGALVLGSFLQLRREWKILPAIVFAVGTVFLANTRPYEGAGLVATLLLLLLIDLVRRRSVVTVRRALASAGVAAVIVAAAGLAMTQQWKAVTGSPLKMPYRLNQEVYGWPLTLPWVSVPAVSYRHRALELYRDWELGEHAYVTEPAKMPLGILIKFSFVWRFFAGIGLSGAFLFARKIFASRQLRSLWIAGGVVTLQVLSEQTGYAHYFAPIAPLILLFLMQGLRYLSHASPRGTPLGPAIVYAAMPLSLTIVLLHAASDQATPADHAQPNYISWCCVETSARDREPLIRRLRAEPGKHLVLLHYELSQYQTSEWTYNDPDIDASDIIFARDMGNEENAPLLRYFQGRRIWRVTVRNDGTEVEQLR